MATKEKRELHEQCVILLLEIEEQENYIEVCKKNIAKGKTNYYQNAYNQALIIQKDKTEKYNEIKAKL